MDNSNKNFLSITIFRLIIIYILILNVVFLYAGCNTNGQSGENISGIVDMETASIAVKDLNIEDLNGDDIYPGDEILVILSLENSGEVQGKDIVLELTSGDLIEIDSGSQTINIDRLDAGETRSVKFDLRVVKSIQSDSKEYFDINISSEGVEISSISREIEILGVKPYERNKIPIIGLHSIEDEIEIPIELSTTNFEILCQTLKDFGYETITFTDLLKYMEHGRALPERSAIITSDDGYQGNYSNAFPVLKKYGYVMTVFLVTGVIGDDDDTRMDNTVFNKRTDVTRPMLTWPEIKEMDEYGCEFLSHTVNHIRLGLASEEEALDELIKSREDIENRLGKDVGFFAWPFDNYSEDKWPLIKEAGYRGAVRYWGGIEDVRTLELNNIKRIEFNSYVSPSQYAGYLGLFDLTIDSSIESTEVKKGDEFELEYAIHNNEDYDIELTSIELELPEGLEIQNILKESDIEQFPAFYEGIFMWVGDGYEIEAGNTLHVVIAVRANKAGSDPIQFRVTSYGSYINAEDVELTIADE